MIIARYKIEYPDKGITQEKNLIEHEHYLQIIKPIQSIVDTIERGNKGKPTKESKQLESVLKSLFGKYWFTNQSAMFRAIDTGVVKAINGEYKCRIIKQ